MNEASTTLEKLYQEDLYRIPSRVLVIVSKPWEEISDSDKLVLHKMIGAVRQNMDAVQIITRSAFTIDDIAALSPTKILTFGATPTPPLKHYELSAIDGIPVIASESLDQLDDARKKILWVALKQMFAL